MTAPIIQFLGAADTVTGSRFLVSDGNYKVMIDCGMFQGEAEINERNSEKFPIDEASIDVILLSHAHLDHSGYIPALVKNGFKGKIFCTEYTAKIAEVILVDSAHLQMTKAKYEENKIKREADPEVIYNAQDVEKSLTHFNVIKVRERIEVLPNIFATFYLSGHILGSTYIVLEIAGKSLLFTGDLGRGNHPFLAGPDKPPTTHLDAVITESTYGDRTHDSPVSDFGVEILAAIKRGGSILIPAFAVDRTEEILFELRKLVDAKVIPSLPIYIDSPMADKVIRHYREAITNATLDIRPEIAEEFKVIDPFDPGHLRAMTSTEESKLLNDITEQSIIVSASGMATGGRIVYHLENMLPDPKNTVILVGFQARGSRGLQLQQGAEKVRIHQSWVNVQAHIANVESFSVHADSNEIISWLKNLARPNEVFIVHGELEGQEALQKRIQTELGWKAIIPMLAKEYPIA